MRRLRRHRLGVWLGVLAVAFYAWLPSHFIGDVAHVALDALEALDGVHDAAAPPHHSHHPGHHDEHHGGTCPICAAAASSAVPAALALPVLAVLPAPHSTAAPTELVEADVPLTPASLTPYAPRGPPPAA